MFPNSNCFPDAVAILAFLSDIVRDIRKYAGPTEMPLIHCDELITDKFTETFAAEMLRNYNNIYLLTSKSKDDEARDLINDEVHERLVNGLIAIKMKKEDITIEKIEAKAEELRLSSEKLEQKLVATDCDKYFAGIVEQYAEKKLEYQKIVEELTEKRKYLKMIKLTYDTKAQKLASKQVEIQKLTYQIQQQKYSVIDIKQLLAKETSIKNSIAMIQAETDAIKIDAANAQVKFARAQKLKLDVIKKFNDFTFQITQKLMQIHSYANLNINDITIDPTASSETILTICSRVHHLKENCAIVKKEHLNKIEQNKARLEELKVYSNRLSQKCTEKMAKRDADERKQNKLTEMYAMYEHDGSLKVAKLQRDIAHQIALKAKMDEDLVNLEKEAEKLAAKNVEIFNEGERKAYEQIREKQTICDEMTKLNDFVDQWTNWLGVMVDTESVGTIGTMKDILVINCFWKLFLCFVILRTNTMHAIQMSTNVEWFSSKNNRRKIMIWLL